MFKIIFRGFTRDNKYYIRYLQNDLKSLYSCVLVNRLLCRIAIPMLWEDPFSVIIRNEYCCNLLDICFLFFNENDKRILKEFLHLMIENMVFNFAIIFVKGNVLKSLKILHNVI